MAGAGLAAGFDAPVAAPGAIVLDEVVEPAAGAAGAGVVALAPADRSKAFKCVRNSISFARIAGSSCAVALEPAVPAVAAAPAVVPDVPTAPLTPLAAVL